MRMAGLAAVLAGLGACVGPATGSGDASCRADGLQDLVGQSETVLHKMKFAPPMRIIHPGTPVTEDYSPTRLNFFIDSAGTITAITCG